MTTDVLTLGEAMASFRVAGRIGFGRPLTPDLAGAESNVAIGLSRLGHSVEWLGRVGADPFGPEVLRALRAEGVTVSHTVVDETAPTGVMFLEQRTADLTRVEYRRAGSAGSGLRIDDLWPTAMDRLRVLHLTGITPALSDSAAATVARAAELASAAGVLVSLDVNHRSRLWSRDDASATLRPLLPHVTLLVAGVDELDVVADGDEDRAVGELFATGVQQVAVKRGAVGASLYTTQGRLDAAAIPVTPIDPVGAGDAFCAGLLSGILDDLDPTARLDRAVLMGAWAVSTAGDWQGLPTRAELPDIATHRQGETVR
ncbi:sugar kinase [Knoellia aerolata]|uniref:Sugar kinase n=1 Tax=Knoellia aerolata DSM 18566 TaxID=1385519 RepID=A0A0A0K039_9MICO|nr:sugar kinase [Knoellia aerolata]KGN41702.1 sugar kinase [Knoellia aerolata DSM 18566]